MVTPDGPKRDIHTKAGDQFSFAPDETLSVKVRPRADVESYPLNSELLEDFLGRCQIEGPNIAEVPHRLTEFVNRSSLREFAFRYLGTDVSYLGEQAEQIVRDIQSVRAHPTPSLSKSVAKRFKEALHGLSSSELQLIVFEAEVAKDELAANNHFVSAVSMREIFDVGKRELRGP